MTKKELRRNYKDIRSTVTEREKKAEKILTALSECNVFVNSTHIFLYFALGSEVPTTEIAKTALSQGKRIAFPKCTDQNGNMEFFYVTSPDELNSGMYGIYEPDSFRCEKAIPDADSLVLVPALAFDKNGYRLGYGKGYYDRYLNANSCYAVGIAFEECVCDNLPHDNFDCKVNCLVTDKTIYCFNQEDTK